MSCNIFISPYLRVILGRVVDIEQSTTSTYREALDKIHNRLLILNSVIFDAEKKADYSAAVSNWLQRLQGVLEKLDDAIDEVQMVSSNNQQSQLMPKQVSSSLSRFNPFKKSENLAQVLQSIAAFLDVISKDSYAFDFVVNNVTNVEHHRRGDESSSYVTSVIYVDRPRIIGREKDVDAVMDLIISKPGAERASVVPIVGFLGVGKTALAQLIYTDSRIQDIFDCRLWLYLPQESGSAGILEILRRVLIEIQGRPIQEDDRDAVQMKAELHELLQMKKAFIVLDDFQDINLSKTVLTLVQDICSGGSAVIVTTRSRRVASLIGTTPPYQLDPLPEDLSYQLLTNRFKDDIQSRSEWEECIARDMVKFCGGVPLFLMMLGSLIRTKASIEEWQALLMGLREGHTFAKIISQDHGIGPKWFDLIPERQVYLWLPLQSFRLQKECGMSVEALTCVWMALGFLHSDDPTLPPESIARKYLLDLVDSPLCSDVEYAPGGVVGCIKFNHALFEAATYSKIQQWGVQALTEDTRYIIWEKADLSGVPIFGYSLNKVRLFILRSRRQASARLVNEIISGFKCLRVLGLGGYNSIEMLPDSLGELKHLRYLDLGGNPWMKRLPASICDLWYLQTLLLHGCSQLQELPANIGRLQNLRYLTLTILMESLPEEMGDLVSLRTLGLSSCPSLASLPTSIKNLKKLQTLGIADCNVLDLRATTSDEGLKGLDAINTLLLSHLPQFVGFPTDLGNPSVVMKHLMIQSCPSLIETAWIMQFRSLQSLTIEDCPQLSALTPTEGTSQLDDLLELVIRSCPSLGNTEWVRELASLRSLIVDDCPKLVELDAGFSKLEKLERLEIRMCPGLSEWFASSAGTDWLLSIPHDRVIELDGVRLTS